MSAPLAATLPISFSTFQPSQALFARAFIAGVAAAASISPADVQVTRAERAPTVNGTALHFQLFGVTQAAADAAAAAVEALFGGPASELTTALEYQGLIGVTLGALLPPPPPPLTAYAGLVTDLRIAFDIPVVQWLISGPLYNLAVTSALAQELGLELSSVWVTQQLGATNGGTVVFLDIILPQDAQQDLPVVDSSGNPATASFPDVAVRFGALFGAARDFLQTSVGDVGSPTLLAALQAFGLPVSACYFADQP